MHKKNPLLCDRKSLELSGHFKKPRQGQTDSSTREEVTPEQTSSVTSTPRLMRNDPSTQLGSHPKRLTSVVSGDCFGPSFD
ncbi:hypothetical protein RRG08_039239 [Elysia crispata]|uniref:Uncharacterized protein n=1 Tax=Elysia crispata TaxID=231223 RepID=A0AAE1BDV1_9GAST|nr:hypothetical protein RRG08_039239 [Elysia crispata]